MRLVLDSGILGKVCHPLHPENILIARWIRSVLRNPESSVIIPEITDYELRRKLLHLVRFKGTRQARLSLDRLNELVTQVRYLPLHSEVMHVAADLWATARGTG